jgi:hypothetical protein
LAINIDQNNNNKKEKKRNNHALADALRTESQLL